MNDISDLSDTIVPKSDQLNAEDLILSNKVITVSKVVRIQPNSFYINYERDDGRPFMPCLTMRKLILKLWGKDGSLWTGRQIEVYCDHEVKNKGQVVGGVRIKAMSGINKPWTLNLTEIRGKKKEYKIAVLLPLVKPNYPADKFTTALPAMGAKVADGTMTSEQIITRCEQSGLLTEEQREKIRAFEKNDINQVFKEGTE